MGMVLVLYQATDTTIDRIVADPPLIWQLVAPDNPEFYRDARRASAGLWARLTGRRDEVPPLALSENEGELVDLDKAWHGIHYLLTESDDDGNAPLDFLIGGGIEIVGQDVGYGTARAFRANDVRHIAQTLEGVSTAELRARYNPDAMIAAEIYPDIWDRHAPDDSPLEYLTEYLETLRRGLRTLVDRQSGMVITIS